MEHHTIEQDITVYCVSAKAYPDGILESHQTLHGQVPYSTDRKYFGISWPEKGRIQYKAAASELHPGELQAKELEKFIVRKGRYVSVLIKNYRNDVGAIGRTFERLIARGDVDPRGYCLEWYVNDHDMQCMVPLKQ